ncbi:MAG: zinc ribbon domain-containing protein, partial [Sedimentisphaerales bacterium]|nr:zinc ribbon domain-containing protein [Sedimentisphaerales bacterium]
AQIIFYESVVIEHRRTVSVKIPLEQPEKGQKPSQEYSAYAEIDNRALYASLGVAQDIHFFEPSTATLWREYARDTVTQRRLPRLKEGTYFDERLGQFVYYKIRQQDEHWIKDIVAYAGPDGFSKTPDESLGRFSGCFIKKDPSRSAQTVIFDQKLRRFFQINFVRQLLVKGDELAPDGQYNPVQIDRIEKMPVAINFNLSVKTPKTHRREKTPPDLTGFSHWGNSILILDETGRIDKLDRKTLKFIGNAGYLPLPSYHPDTKVVPAKNLLAYKVIPLFTDDKYNGMVVTNIGRDSLIPEMFFFNKDGRFEKHRYAKSMDEIWYPCGPLYLVSRYLLENLQPPILSMAAFYTADSFDAISAQQALFVNTNSFIGMFGRDKGVSRILRFFAALFFISPSILLSVFLSWRVTRNAAAVGLSRPARQYWRIGVICLSLPAYITYRLTCPKIRMVTCPNCGNLRRPDMQICHYCNSPWHIPELAPPTWRVLD